MIKTFLFIASLSMALSVIFGAFGAHALKEKLSPEMLSIFETGVKYQIYHALGIFISAILMRLYPSLDLSVTVYLFISGILFFSGSLYVLSITGIKTFGAITPFGGLMFILGWFMMAWKIFKNL